MQAATELSSGHVVLSGVLWWFFSSALPFLCNALVQGSPNYGLRAGRGPPRPFTWPATTCCSLLAPARRCGGHIGGWGKHPGPPSLARVLRWGWRCGSHSSTSLDACRTLLQRQAALVDGQVARAACTGPQLKRFGDSFFSGAKTNMIKMWSLGSYFSGKKVNYCFWKPKNAGLIKRKNTSLAGVFTPKHKSFFKE